MHQKKDVLNQSPHSKKIKRYQLLLNKEILNIEVGIKSQQHDSLSYINEEKTEHQQQPVKFTRKGYIAIELNRAANVLW